jgi:membrane protein
MLHAAADNADGEGLALVIGMGALLFAATGAFAQLQAALNRAWSVRPDPNASTIRDFLGKRLLSMGMIITIGFLLLVSLALSALITAASQAMVRPLLGSVSDQVVQTLDFLANVLVFWLLFSVMLRWMPDARIEWRDVWAGALATTVLFVAGKYAVAFYLGRGDAGRMFGAAGALAVLMLWLYFASMIVLFGAELTEVWASMNGREPAPESGAIHVMVRRTP